MTIFKEKGSLASRPKDLITYKETNLYYHHIWIATCYAKDNIVKVLKENSEPRILYLVEQTFK